MFRRASTGPRLLRRRPLAWISAWIALFVLWAATWSAAAASQAAQGSGGYPRVVTDGAGQPVRLDHLPRRIVSATLGSDEIILSLVPASRVTAVTSLATDPTYSFVVDKARSVPNKIVRANAEQIIALQPDLVFVASYTAPEVVRQLQDAGLPVFRFQFFDSIDRIADHVLQVGQAVGAEGEARQIVADIRARLDEVARRLRSVSRRYTVLHYTSTGYVPGAQTSVGDMIEKAGGINAAAKLGLQGWQKIGLEQVVAMNPDVIVVSSGEGAGFARELAANPALQGVTAVRQGRVYVLDEKYFATVSHFIVEGVEALARRLYPEAMAGYRPPAQAAALSAAGSR